MKIVTFELANEMYGLPIERVQSIEAMQPIRKVPLSKQETMGVMNLRGVVTTVKDMRILLGLQSMDITDRSRLIISDHTAYLVDTADSIVECTEEAIQQVNQVESQHIQGVVQLEEQLITLLRL